MLKLSWPVLVYWLLVAVLIGGCCTPRCVVTNNWEERK